MGARSAILLVMVGCGIAAASEPKPKEVDVKQVTQWLVLEDAHGSTFAVAMSMALTERLVFYGQSGKALYQVPVHSRSANGATWSLAWYALRLSGITPATLEFREGGSYTLSCPTGDELSAHNSENTAFKEVPADRAKQIVAKAKFLSNGYTHTPRLLARDDTGIYYYVDELAPTYGGGGVRVFIGKKGGMKEVQLLDVASDSDGAVYSTKSGDVRLVVDRLDSTKRDATFIKGQKRASLRVLDVVTNTALVYRDLGIYNLQGLPCEAL